MKNGRHVVARFATLLALVLAAVLVLPGCSRLMPDTPSFDKFVGAWELKATIIDGKRDESVSEQRVLYFDLDDDGSVLFTMPGAQMDGTWKLDDDNKIVFVGMHLFDSAVLDGDELKVKDYEGDYEIFTKISDVPDMNREKLDELDTTGLEGIVNSDNSDEATATTPFDQLTTPMGERFQEIEPGVLGDSTAKDATLVEPVNRVVYEDDTLKIEFEGIGTGFGPDDKEVLFRITNKTDKNIDIHLSDAKLNGESRSSMFLIDRVPAHKTIRSVLGDLNPADLTASTPLWVRLSTSYTGSLERLGSIEITLN